MLGETAPLQGKVMGCCVYLWAIKLGSGALGSGSCGGRFRKMTCLGDLEAVRKKLRVSVLFYVLAPKIFGKFPPKFATF